MMDKLQTTTVASIGREMVRLMEYRHEGVYVDGDLKLATRGLVDQLGGKIDPLKLSEGATTMYLLALLLSKLDELP